MTRASGTFAVRLSLWTLVFAALAMALVQPANAGTADAPEIQDPANDQAVTTVGESTCPNSSVCQFTRADILQGYVQSETASDVTVAIVINFDPVGASNTASYSWEFHLTVGGTEVVASASSAGGAAPTAPAPGGVATAAVVDGSTLLLTFPKSALASSTDGTVLTSLFVAAKAQTLAGGFTLVSDRAPDGSGFGQDYTLGGGGNGTCGNCTAGDSDGDGMNDTCEQTYFHDLSHNATADEDGDGLTNGQECALGTDPANPDTDGDGANDKDDSAPTDPTKGGSGSNGTTSSTSSTSRSSTSSSSASKSSTTGGSSTEDTCADDDASDAADCLQSSIGYIGMSAGGFLAVLVLCIIALAVRWSL